MVTLVDRRNYHLFQPLIYHAAMAGLSPADNAAPLRSILSKQRNASVLCETVQSIELGQRKIQTSFGPMSYEYLLSPCGSLHSFFGNNDWEEYAFGLNTLEQASKIDNQQAFERDRHCRILAQKDLSIA